MTCWRRATAAANRRILIPATRHRQFPSTPWPATHGLSTTTGSKKSSRRSGGARPKANVGFNPGTGEVMPPDAFLPAGFEPWIVKFNASADGNDAGALEFVYAELAAGRFFATRRFDRAPGGRRLHLHSAAGLLHADSRPAATTVPAVARRILTFRPGLC